MSVEGGGGERGEGRRGRRGGEGGREGREERVGGCGGWWWWWGRGGGGRGAERVWWWGGEERVGLGGRECVCAEDGGEEGSGSFSSVLGVECRSKAFRPTKRLRQAQPHANGVLYRGRLKFCNSDRRGR